MSINPGSHEGVVLNLGALYEEAKTESLNDKMKAVIDTDGDVQRAYQEARRLTAEYKETCEAFCASLNDVPDSAYVVFIVIGEAREDVDENSFAFLAQSSGLVEVIENSETDTTLYSIPKSALNFEIEYIADDDGLASLIITTSPPDGQDQIYTRRILGEGTGYKVRALNEMDIKVSLSPIPSTD